MTFKDVNFDTYFHNYPDKDGYFGKYGGVFIEDKLKKAMEEITSALRETGMELLGVFSDWSFSEPNETTERWYFVARAVK